MVQTHGGLVGRCQALCKKRSNKQNLARYAGSGGVTKGRLFSRPFFVHVLVQPLINR